MQFLRERIGDGRVSARQELLSDREAWQSGISKSQGYEPVAFARIARYSHVVFGQADVAVHLGFQEPVLDKSRKPLVDVAGIRIAVADCKDAIPVDGWRVVQQGKVDREFSVRGHARERLPYVGYENLTPLPRAYVLGRAVPVDVTGTSSGSCDALSRIANCCCFATCRCPENARNQWPLRSLASLPLGCKSSWTGLRRVT